jgi:hypothetical protein
MIVVADTTPLNYLVLQPLRSQPDRGRDYLDPGEREAIALAEELKADQILLDEAEARQDSTEKPPMIELISMGEHSRHPAAVRFYATAAKWLY